MVWAQCGGQLAAGQLPLGFLRGVGLPDNFVDYLPSLLGEPIQFYNYFISYSSKDQALAGSAQTLRGLVDQNLGTSGCGSPLVVCPCYSPGAST